MINTDALETCRLMMVSLEKKANHNKIESLWSFKLIMVLTLVTPILIGISEHWIVGKLLPSLCAAIASFLTAWVKLRKPESLWELYRSGQRKMENEIRFYQHGVTPYDVESSDKLLIKNVSAILDSTHAGWAKLVPNTNDVSTTVSNIAER